MRTTARLIAAAWLGGAFFLIAIAAPAAFSAAPNPTAAADVVGAMLTRWHYVALLAPLLLLAFEWRRPHGWLVAVLFAAIIFASFQAVVDTRIRAMRRAAPVPISALRRDDPLRRRFGLLHGLSSILLLAQAVAAAAVVIGAEDTDR